MAPVSFVITPDVEVQPVAPDSNPPLVRAPVPPPPPVEQASVGAALTPVHAATVAVHWVDDAPYRSRAALTMPFAACG